MKKREVGMAAIGLIFLAAVGNADNWGNGLGNEYKTNLVPKSQQSGWETQGKPDTPPSAGAAVQGPAEVWGNGLGCEYKTSVVPQGQQSGWGLKGAETSVQTAAAVPAPAEAWGNGWGAEYKTPTVPAGQQSGWPSYQAPAPTERAQASQKPKKAKAEKKEPQKAAKIVDSDRDGVADDQDNCEDTPKGVKVDAKGCPKNAKAIPENDWTLSGIQFETGSDKIKSSSKAPLDEAADVLKTHTRVKVEVQGHTDNVGNPADNQTLSEKRAIAVRDYLIAKGVSAKRLEAKGYGQKAPIASNNTDEGRAKNRRIQFKVLKK